MSTIVDVLGKSERVYLSDDDPELVGAALPFNIKTIETLLESSPENRDLLLNAAKTLTLYAYGFVEPEIWELEYSAFEESEEVRKRAARLYHRAYAYGARGLEVEHPGIAARLKRAPEEAAAALALEDVPLAVWSAAALGGAINTSKDDPESTADVAVVGALLERALELDADYDKGTIHEFLFAYEAGRPSGSKEKARQHYQRALELGDGKHPSIWLSWAEGVSVKEQNRAEFEELLERVLAFDVEEYPDNRLLNLLAQRRARWLETSIDELFLEGNDST